MATKRKYIFKYCLIKLLLLGQCNLERKRKRERERDGGKIKLLELVTLLNILVLADEKCENQSLK
jgi:hypothetical protein